MYTIKLGIKKTLRLTMNKEIEDNIIKKSMLIPLTFLNSSCMAPAIDDNLVLAIPNTNKVAKCKQEDF